MNFITLFDKNIGRYIWVNVDRIIEFSSSLDGKYSVINYGGNDISHVTETPQEIIAKIIQNEQ